MRRLAARIKPLVATLVLALVLPVAAFAATAGTRQTALLTPAPGGVPANGDNDNLSFSQDNRNVRLAAWDTSATNLVPQDTNGKRDVVIFRRAAGEGNLDGVLDLASVNNQGVQANGDSRRPRIDGSSRSAARCLVYESEATNLDPRDRTPDTDVFLRDTRADLTVLVSRQGSGSHADIDGACEAVVYAAAGRIMVFDVQQRKAFAVARGETPDMQNNGKGAAYVRGGQVYYQAFQKVNRIVNKRTGKRGFIWIKIGREQLVSRSKSGQPGNGPSANPTMDDNGYYVSFESDATNLCVDACSGISDDTNGVRDIFRRTLPRRPGGGKPAPTSDFMQMASFSCGARAQGDPCAVNAQANGASRNAFMTGAGENIVFESTATNLRESTSISLVDPNGPVSDIYYWNFPRGRMAGNVSRESRTNAPRAGGQAFDAPSSKPAASNRANYIGWTSPASTGLASKQAGVADLFIRFLGGSHEGLESG